MIKLHFSGSYRFFKLLPTKVRVEISVVNEFDTDFLREKVCAVAGEQYVFGSFHNEPGELYGVLDVANKSDRPGFQGGAVHDRRVQFDLADRVEERADAGVEGRVVLQHAHGRLHRVEGGAARAQHRPARLQGRRAAGFVGLNLIIRHIPGAAVNDQSRHVLPLLC